MRRRFKADRPEIPIAPMIDCVFLMLVYFMTTSSLDRSEADLPCPVAQGGALSDPLPAVDEQRIQLTGDGYAHWNGSQFLILGEDDGRLELSGRLESFRKTCELAESKPSIRILLESKVPYQALITLLDLITEAGIESLQLP